MKKMLAQLTRDSSSQQSGMGQQARLLHLKTSTMCTDFQFLTTYFYSLHNFGTNTTAHHYT